ncbi:DUF4097 family beta strand repeat-containing protein [Streptomyces sp. NPDC050504]|uniref:DUF4097 family beta strand repeat-containing protein n=1 Tax=Streptomyces sp. NPDC050504 TaxID=3365618 RepID=UPI00378F1ED9
MQTFATTAAVTTVLEIPAGRVQFIAADRADAVVEVRPANPAKNRDVKAAQETRVDFREGILRIEAEAKNHLAGAAGTIEVTVQLPVGSHVEAKAASLDLRGVGRLGDVAFEGAQATVKLDEAMSARLTAAAGDVTLGRLTGPAEIGVQKGDIRITEAVRGTLVLRTEAGDVSVTAAHGVSATLDAGTVYGRIHNELKNDGTTALHIRATTSHGDIHARSL